MISSIVFNLIFDNSSTPSELILKKRRELLSVEMQAIKITRNLF